MIRVQDWIASIPDEEKHIAYVGEGKTEQREFLLCGTDWEKYKDFTFHLDMAFDPVSITTHDSRQVVQTTHNSTETKATGGTTVDEVTTKETYTVDNVQTTNHDLTDISPLSKTITADGIRLTWTVLRQHTVLPGRLWATMRAANAEQQQVKKSAIMVFEVDAAICAVAATVPPISEFEQMEQQMDALRQQTERAATEAARSAAEALSSAEYAVDAAATTTVAADSAFNSQEKAVAAANEAKKSAADAASSAQQAQAAANTASDQAVTAADAASATYTYQQSAAAAAADAGQALVRCNKHSFRAEEAAAQCNRYAEAAEASAKRAEAASGGGGEVIIDVVELPTEDINERYFYRLLRATLFTNREYACHTVLSLPAVGEPFESGKNKLTVYHNINDNTPYGYVTSALSSAKGVSEGWHSLDELATPFDYVYGGVVSSIKEVTNTSAVYLFVTTVTYSYDGRLWKPVSDEYNRINVRDYGAVGDGVTDDRAAIIAAFDKAKTMLPCEVYFPAGTYGISNGITIYMEYGTGGLRVRGAGRDTTTIKYLDSYNPRRNDIHWYALRIWPVGMPDTKPTSEDEYLHDISYMGLTVHDPDPCAHATHASKGDTTQEETHGFDLHYCKGVSVTDCQFITVGDEAIDICACRDVIVMNNRLVGSPGAGPGGGAISINDGCNGVVVSGNTINGSAPDEVLPDGTVITKKNNGIVVESLSLSVQNVTISGNSIRNMHGVGVKMYNTKEGTGVDNIIVANNVISGCDYGIITEGTILKSGIKIHNNIIADCTANAMDMVGINDMSVCGNTFRNIGADKAIKAFASCGNSTQLYADNLFENVAFGAMYVAGTVAIKNCVFKGVGVTENIPSTKTEYGIFNYNGDIVVSGCVMKDVRAKVLKAAISRNNSTTGTLRIENTDIELMSASLVANAGGDAVTVGGSIFGGVIGGRIAINQANAIVQGVTVVSSNMGGHGITLNASGVSVTGCNIQMNKVSSKGAIGEASGVNNNIIANNITNQAIVTVGANTVAVNNIVTT